MSYTEHDAWIDEKGRGDWPFEGWTMGTLPLLRGYDYFNHPHGHSGIGSLHHRLKSALDYKKHNDACLRQWLDAAIEIVNVAIENSDLDAFSAWSRHDVWLPVIDDSLNALDEPADMLAQSIDYVGSHHEHSEQEISAALGLWLIGDWTRMQRNKDYGQDTALIQIGVSVAETEYYRGLSDGRNQEIQKVTKSTRNANDHRHAANRERTRDAEKWWLAEARGKTTSADAARHISAKFHVVEVVAKRWIREFKRKAGD